MHCENFLLVINMNRTVLITGGAGFVGRHFTEYFLKNGDTVYCVDSIVSATGGKLPTSWYFNPRSYKRFKFYEEDCRTFFKRSKLPRFDYVFHLAAMVGGRLMIENNPLVVADDLSIDSLFWQWATRAKPKKVITFSSSAVYPIMYQRKNNHKLLVENMIRFDGSFGMPDMTYGWAKLTTEYLGRLAYEKYGVRSVVYRPFSGYGEDQDLTYPFPTIMKRISEVKGNTIAVWGSGKQMRDFIHIDDCVRGVVETMDKIDNGDALNLSTGKLTSFSDLVHIAGDILGKKFKVETMGTKPEGVFARGGDTKKQKLYGFKAKISLKEGIERILCKK
jgi:nucleoside-diphosphate-sugar epimerase